MARYGYSSFAVWGLQHVYSCKMTTDIVATGSSGCSCPGCHCRLYQERCEKEQLVGLGKSSKQPAVPDCTGKLALLTGLFEPALVIASLQLDHMF